MRQHLFFEDRLKDFANDRREADGPEFLGPFVRGLFATGVTIARRQSSGTWIFWSERLNIRASTGAMWELRALRTLGKSPSGPAQLFFNISTELLNKTVYPARAKLESFKKRPIKLSVGGCPP